MENGEKAPSALLYIVLSLCVLNLAGTGYLVLRQTIDASGTASGAAAGTRIPLPSELTLPQARVELFEKVMDFYNNKTPNDFYLFFDELMRVRVSKEKFAKTLKQVHVLSGDIESGVYTHYEARESHQGVKNYALYYAIRAHNGEAVLTLSILQQRDEPFRLIGFHINMQ